MKTLRNLIRHQISRSTVLLAALACLTAGTMAQAQATAPSVSPDVQDIVRFSQAHMTDDVILAYIKKQSKSYNLTADQVVYLNSQGVSQAVISALLQASGPAADNSAPPPVAAAPPSAAPAPVAPAPPPGLADFFNAEDGLNPAFWTTQGNALSSLAAANGSLSVMPALAFGPAGMQMSGISGPQQFAGVQSVGTYSAPFTLTARVTGLAEAAIPFEVYLVSPDFQQWLSVAGHLGGTGRREGDVHVGAALPFFRGAVNIPLGHGPSPEHGVWVNYTGSALPLATLGNKICEPVAAGVPYTIQMTVGPDGMGSVAFLDAAGVTLGARAGMPVGTGPFNIVLASRNGPVSANWQSVELTPLAPPVAVVAPAVPTFDYFQAQLTPYGHWIDAPGVGSCWVPAEAAYPGWRPYVDAGHWEYTDAGWYWRSDYAWGEIAFHYGRWLNDARTGFVWAWAPAYDWAPSWVTWRYDDADGCMGWAPLPWDARFEAGVGIMWHGGVAVDVDFGLQFDAFVFVGRDHFWDHDYAHVLIGRDDARRFYGRSEIHNGYRMDHGRFVADGWGRERVAAFTHHEVAVQRAHELRTAEEHHNLQARHEQHPTMAARNEEHARPGATASRQPGRAETTTERAGVDARTSNHQPYAKKTDSSKKPTARPSEGEKRQEGEQK